MLVFLINDVQLNNRIKKAYFYSEILFTPALDKLIG